MLTVFKNILDLLLFHQHYTTYVKNDSGKYVFSYICEIKSKGNKMNKKIVLDFINAINEHDIDGICSLMADDHKFIDANGNEVTGKDRMRNGWIAYFLWFPDYKIEITDIFVQQESVQYIYRKDHPKQKLNIIGHNFIAAFGFAGGTYKGMKTDDNKYFWRLPASWKAKVSGGKIKLWQVYCDTKIPYDIINNY